MELYKKTNRFQVSPYCPCGKSNKDGKFVPFIESGKILIGYGYCHSCGKSFFPESKTALIYSILPQIEKKEIDYEEVMISFINYEKNNLVNWFISKEIEIQPVLKSYKVGTDRNGATIFWYIDFYGCVRNAKIIHYKIDGHRDKSKHPFFKYKKENGYDVCLFGENLLNRSSIHKVVVLVESEKTAIIGNYKFPEFCWIASGGSNGITKEKGKVLTKRKVIIVPDCDEAGRNSAERTKKILMDNGASDVLISELDINLNQGEDIADLL